MKRIVCFLVCGFILLPACSMAKDLFCIEGKCYSQKEIMAFKKLMPPNFRTSKEELCKALLRMYLVEREAKTTHFIDKPEIKDALKLAYLKTLYRLYMQNIVYSTPITDKILKSYYVAHKKEFSIPLRYQMTKLTLKKWFKEKANLKQLSKIAMSKEKNIYTDEQMVILFGKNFVDQVRKLKQGQCALLKLPDQVVAFCLEKKLPPELLPFEQVKKQIKKKLLDLKGSWLVEKELEKLNKKYKPQVKEPKCSLISKP